MLDMWSVYSLSQVPCLHSMWHQPNQCLFLLQHVGLATIWVSWVSPASPRIWGNPPNKKKDRCATERSPPEFGWLLGSAILWTTPFCPLYVLHKHAQDASASFQRPSQGLPMLYCGLSTLTSQQTNHLNDGYEIFQKRGWSALKGYINL